MNQPFYFYFYFYFSSPFSSASPSPRLPVNQPFFSPPHRPTTAARMDRPNYITPAGYGALKAEYDQLFATERPALVETIAWAAGNGDRSENGDYIYGRKRLREIDRRLGFLARRMKAAKVVDPARQADRTRIWFGATVTIADEDDQHRTLTLVGDDEADAGAGRIGWNAPLARALRGAAVGDLRKVMLPAGEREYEVTAIDYPADPDGRTGA